MTLPPGHTCPAIDRAIRHIKRAAKARTAEARGNWLDNALIELEQVRDENVQMRKAWASERDRRKALEASR